MLEQFIARIIFFTVFFNPYEEPISTEDRITNAREKLRYACIVESAQYTHSDGGTGIISNAPKSFFATWYALGLQNANARTPLLPTLALLNYRLEIKGAGVQDYVFYSEFGTNYYQKWGGSGYFRIAEDVASASNKEILPFYYSFYSSFGVEGREDKDGMGIYSGKCNLMRE